MKYLILPALLLALATSVHAQNHDYLPKYFFQLGGGPAQHNGVFSNIGGTAIFENKWMASLSYQSIDMDPKNLPSDYIGGYTIIILIPIPDEMPAVKLNSINLTAGKYVPLGRKTWITGEAGVAFISGDKLTFNHQQIENEGLHVSSNYRTMKESTSAAGGILKLDFTWAIVPYVGIGVGAFANMNGIQSTTGLEFKVIAGWLNTKRLKA